MCLTVCIIYFDEESNIRRCLKSATWVDEIIVVDSISPDKAVEIAREYTDKVFERARTGYADQKNRLQDTPPFFLPRTLDKPQRVLS